MKLMTQKKSIFAVSALLALSLTAFAAGGSVDALNTTVKNLLAQFNNEATIAKMAFNQLETNADRATKFDAKFQYRKTGKRGTIGLNMPLISYVYDETNPTAKVSMYLEANLLDLSGGNPESFNKLETDGEKFVKDFVTDFVKRYGNNGTSTFTSQIKKDTNGNIVAGTFTIEVKINIAALPEEQQAAEVAQSAKVTLSVNRDKGIGLSGVIVLNPKNASFSKEGLGMKEYVEALLAQNPDAIKQIQDMFKFLDDSATSFMNSKN